MTSLRQVLVEVLRERAARYTEDDIMKLVANDYTDKEALQTATRDGLLQAGLTPGKVDELLTRFSDAAASGANTSGADVESDGPGETVVLKFKDAGGLQQEIPAYLYKSRLHGPVLTDLLSSMKLSLLMVKGAAPNYDEQGYLSMTFQPGEVVELTTSIRPGTKLFEAYGRREPWWHRLIRV